MSTEERSRCYSGGFGEALRPHVLVSEPQSDAGVGNRIPTRHPALVPETALVWVRARDCDAGVGTGNPTHKPALVSQTASVWVRVQEQEQEQEWGAAAHSRNPVRSRNPALASSLSLVVQRSSDARSGTGDVGRVLALVSPWDFDARWGIENRRREWALALFWKRAQDASAQTCNPGSHSAQGRRRRAVRLPSQI